MIQYRQLTSNSDGVRAYAVFQSAYPCRESVSSIVSAVTKGFCFGAFKDSQLVAVFLGDWINMGEGYHLTGCYVRPDQKPGVGVRLAGFAFERINDAHPGAEVYFSTALKNEIVKKMAYEAKADTINVRQRHTPTGEDAILFKIKPQNVARCARKYKPREKQLSYSWAPPPYKLWGLK